MQTETRSLVILPTFNERPNLQSMVTAVLGQGAFEVLVVDDNSPDGTGEVAEALTGEYPGRVFVLHRTGKLGLGTAYVMGFRWALARKYDYIFEMDSDFSHDPSSLPAFLRAIERHDVVIGSRYVPGGSTPDWSPLRRAISRGGSLYARALLGIPIHDLTSGFKCFRRSALMAIDLAGLRSNGYAFQVEVNHECFCQGLRLNEIPITFRDRRAGHSKMSARIVLEALRVVWILRSNLSRDTRHSASHVDSKIGA